MAQGAARLSRTHARNEKCAGIRAGNRLGMHGWSGARAGAEGQGERCTAEGLRATTAIDESKGQCGLGAPLSVRAWTTSAAMRTTWGRRDLLPAARAHAP